MAALEDTGWQPIALRRSGAESFVVSPFARLARAHAAAVAGDTLIALALADSLFFSIDPSDARPKVLLYLALTMAPFGVVAPLIGPWLDRIRGGRGWLVIGANALRVVICLFMIRDLDRLYLFPEAFSVLVLSKSYHIAKSALVPTVVRSDEELVIANSRLSLLSGLVSLATAIPGVAAMGLARAIGADRGQGALVLAVVVFSVAAYFGTKIPSTRVATDRADTLERTELRGGGILLAASAMGLLRGIVGFLTFLLAFELRTDDTPPWKFGTVIVGAAIGGLAGAAIAPALRRNGMTEERIIQVLLGVVAAGALVSIFVGSTLGAPLLGATVAVAAAGGKLAFDAIVQRDAPDANRGRSFARFETRFQLAWVVGAILPVLLPTPLWVGFLIVSGVAAFALMSYLASLKAIARGEPLPDRSRLLRERLRRVRSRSAPPPDDSQQPDVGPPSDLSP